MTLIERTPLPSGGFPFWVVPLEEKDPLLKNNHILFGKLKLRGVLFVQTLHLGTNRNGNPPGGGFPVINFH